MRSNDVIVPRIGGFQPRVKPALLVICRRLELGIDLEHVLDGLVTALLQLATFPVLARVHPLAVVRVDRLRRWRPMREIRLVRRPT